MVKGRNRHFCVRTTRSSGIPVKVFLVRLRPDCHTDLFDPTTLRSLIDCYRIGSCRGIDIGDIGFGFIGEILISHFCCTSRNTHSGPIFLDVVEMDMVLTSRILMVASLDRDFISPVCLTIAIVPDNIILTVLVRPNRYLNRLHSFRTEDI